MELCFLFIYLFIYLFMGYGALLELRRRDLEMVPVMQGQTQ